MFIELLLMLPHSCSLCECVCVRVHVQVHLCVCAFMCVSVCMCSVHLWGAEYLCSMDLHRVCVQCAFMGGCMYSVHLYVWECVCSVHLGGGHVSTHTEAGRCKVPSPVTQHLISMR